MLDKETKRWAVKAHDLPRFLFYQVPQLLFYGKYRVLTNNARMLYSMIWEKVKFSSKNGWIDEEGFLFVRLARKTAQFKLCIDSHHTVQRCYEMLEELNLIYRRRNGKTIVDDVYPLLPDDAEATKEAYEQLKLVEAEEEAAFSQFPIV